MKQSEFKGISKRGRELLSGGEDRHVEYEETVKGLQAEHLVAFANSLDGGYILIGVKQETDTNGQKTGVPIGCKTDDEAKLQIVDTALSCSPPVQIEIYAENTSSASFFRIEIPSGSKKPYCTNSGTYKIREDERNHALHPEQLLSMFLEREGEEIKSGFYQAAGNLENKMANTIDIVGDLENIISLKIDEISSSMSMAEYEATSVKNTIADVESYTHAIHRKSKAVDKRLKALLAHLEANDPVKEEAKEEVYSWLIEKLEEDEELLEAAKKGKSLTFTMNSENAAELDKEDFQQLLARAIKEFSKESTEGGSDKDA